MNKSFVYVFIFIGVLVIFLAVVNFSHSGNTDWRPSYNTKDKTPLGLYILAKEIDGFFTTPVQQYKEGLHDYFLTYDTRVATLHDVCLININLSFDADKKQIQNLCEFVRQGNGVFLSGYRFSDILMDSLKLSQYSKPYRSIDPISSDTVSLQLDGHEQILSGTKTITGSYLKILDKSNTEILGTSTLDSIKNPNFVKINMGKGSFFIHLEPAVFTNYHLLRDLDYKYTEKVLANISDRQDIVWLLHKQTSSVISESPLRFIMSQPALKWAWYLIISGILIFTIFNIRRSQRIIPIIPKPVNTSVEFAKTIGNLYRLEGDVKNIIDKKIIYFLEKIRSEYHLQTEVLDDRFITSLHTKSGKDKKIIQKLVLLVNKHRQFDYACTIHDLKLINDTIENFYKI